MNNNLKSTTKWYIYTKKADFNSLAEEHDITPVTARIMINRDVAPGDFDTFLYGDISAMHDPHLMKDIDKAAALIKLAIMCKKKIRVVGDYDVDGVTSTYMLLDVLTKLGADVSFEIPDRVKDGYGINERIIEDAHSDGINLILTCDNGISAKSAIEKARSYGMQVIITDHHEVPKNEDGSDDLPNANFVINPKRADDGYPFKEICGGMVAYKLSQVLCEESDIDVCENIVFAAIATIGDVMPLKDENRIAVKEGLKKVSETNNIGLKKLIEICGLDAVSITAYSIGFVIGPCLNASGRLESAKTALKLLLTKDESEAAGIASYLKQLNDSRKEMTEEGLEKAMELVDEGNVQVLYLPETHESVAGIVAGRVRELTNHPVIVLTNKGILKGSARSIDSYNIFEALCSVKDILEKFGGHKLAAGLSIKEENLPEFRNRLNENADLSPEDFIQKIWIDCALPFGAISERIVDELALLEPFGQSNEKPAFALKNVKILSAKAMGKAHNVVKLSLKDEAGSVVDGIIFGDADVILSELALAPEHKFDILYYPQVNEYMGNRNLQVVLKGWKI